MSFKVSVDDKSFDVDIKDGIFFINEEEFPVDIKRTDEHKLHLIYNNRTHLIEVMELAKAEKTVKLKINGTVTNAKVKDKFDLLLEKMGLSLQVEQVLKELKAPMPGLILEIKVEAGSEVKKGDPLLVLEAMKMENIIKAPGDGIISSIKIEVGNSVEKNQVLIEFA
jgi:biotin carboxyl carrier protein